MKCPFCSDVSNRVVDSRLGKDAEMIRRRRECLACGRRFSTFESVETVPMSIIKKDGRREAFAKNKVRAGMIRACEKRPVSVNAIDAFVDQLEQDLLETGKRELPAAAVGQRVMDQLHALDDVAYIRFASVYHEFQDANDFAAALKKMLDSRKKSKKVAKDQ